MKKLLAILGGAFATLLVLASPAAASGPTPPVPGDILTAVLSAFGDAIADLVTVAASNVWVIALFGMGLALGIARAVVNRGGNKVKSSIA